jgi:hypothetical protein
MLQAGFIVIDKDRGSYVHGVYQAQSFLYATLDQGFLHFGGNIDKPTPVGYIEPEFFTV